VIINAEIKNKMRIPYALRRVPEASFAHLLPCPETPYRGVIALAEVEKVGKNTNLELSNGRRCALHEGDTLAVVFGNRYATMQFEGYARTNGAHCDLLSMGGLCGLVESRHVSVGEPTKLHLLGAIGDENQRQLQLTDYALRPASRFENNRWLTRDIRVMVVCGTSMDSGKTHSVMSAIMGLRRRGHRVAGIKLTGSAAGRDTWNMLDAGADVALDFIDGGFPSTYLCTPEELLNLHNSLLGEATVQGAEWAVIEIADGLLQPETAALLRSPWFRSTVDHFLFAAGEPMAALAGVTMLRNWEVEPLAVSGVVSMSSLSIREAEEATKVRCLTAAQLQNGELAPLQKAGVNFPLVPAQQPQGTVNRV
jgi:hypothetical protein